MNEPRRLSQSGGLSQRLLDSASIDKPSEAARRRAAAFAGTVGAFASSTSGETSTKRPKHKQVKTFVTWIAIGAAASATLAVLGSQLLDSAAPTPAATGNAMVELPAPPPRNPDISAENSAAPHLAPAASAASADQVREIEAARAAITRGDNTAAIALLNAYDASHPSGDLKPDSMALRVQALNSSGKIAEARTLANEFVAKYPTHPLVERVKAMGQ